MEKINNKIQYISLKKSMIAIFTLSVLLIGILTGITIGITSTIRQNLMDSRPIRLKMAEGEGIKTEYGYIYNSDQVQREPLNTKQKVIYYVDTAAMVLLPVLYMAVVIFRAASIYYKLKLRQPIDVLRDSIQNISGNNLDFSIECSSKDELGALCSAMEKMRSELSSNQRKVWKLMEERKALNASVAHDLRTPITVIKGYLEYLEKNLPIKNITDQVLEETISYMAEATQRLERYVISVRDIQKLEDIDLKYEEVNMGAFTAELESNGNLLAERYRKRFAMEVRTQSQVLEMDVQIAFRILENLLDNGFRHAAGLVSLLVEERGEYLILDIRDDGKGFDEKILQQGTSLFYPSGKEKGHLGLLISKTLSEKHGGGLSFGSCPGALVTLKIKVK